MKCKSKLSRPAGRVGDDCGIALPLALMAFVVLAALSAALLAIGSSEVQIASNHLRNTQAQFLAEAGLEDTFNVFRPNANLVTTNVPTTLTSVPGLSGPGTTLAAIGNYTVKYQAAGTNTVRVVSTGNSVVGGSVKSTKVLRATMSTSFISKYAILTDDVDVGGNGRVQGPLGVIHGNSKTKVEGSAFVDQTATSASNTCDGCTDASRVGVPGYSGPNKPAQPIPLVNPLDFLPMADFIFGDGTTVVNGITVPVNKIFERATGLLITLPGWSMQGPGEWSFSGGTTPPNGTFYASKEIKIAASPGSAGSPWRATFVAGAASGGGEVEIEGHPNIVPYLQDLLIIADKAEVKGTGGDASLTGAIVARDEVEMEGSANLTGNVISTGKVKIKGNATITYSDGTVTTLIGPLQILSWGL